MPFGVFCQFKGHKVPHRSLVEGRNHLEFEPINDPLNTYIKGNIFFFFFFLSFAFIAFDKVRFFEAPPPPTILGKSNAMEIVAFSYLLLKVIDFFHNLLPLLNNMKVF